MSCRSCWRKDRFRYAGGTGRRSGRRSGSDSCRSSSNSLRRQGASVLAADSAAVVFLFFHIAFTPQRFTFASTIWHATRGGLTGKTVLIFPFFETSKATRWYYLIIQTITATECIHGVLLRPKNSRNKTRFFDRIDAMPITIGQFRVSGSQCERRPGCSRSTIARQGSGHAIRRQAEATTSPFISPVRRAKSSLCTFLRTDSIAVSAASRVD